jgi:hypothetical protein
MGIDVVCDGSVFSDCLLSLSHDFHQFQLIDNHIYYTLPFFLYKNELYDLQIKGYYYNL